jgi:endonuclease III
MMSASFLTLGQAVERLHETYGPPEWPPSDDPFDLVLWENVAYLADPARRREAFEMLEDTIGTSPHEILEAPLSDLERVTSKGILGAKFAQKLRECARIAHEEFDGDLDEVVHEPLPVAKKALQSFPGIGEPGAEKILLFSGRQALLAPDSNGLRVLVRLGLVREDKSYARTYASAREAAKSLPATPRAMQEAHLLLQLHGQTLCKRTDPRCGACPLAHGCDYARRGARKAGHGPSSRVTG